LDAIFARLRASFLNIQISMFTPPGLAPHEGGKCMLQIDTPDEDAAT
jgi:hypothetical protein